MASHIFNLEVPFNREKCGNAISTDIEWDGNAFQVFRKDEQRSLNAKKGDRVRVCCNGGFPDVVLMKSPSDPLKNLFWEYKFFQSKRKASMGKVREVATSAKKYDYARGCYIVDGSFYKALDGKSAIAVVSGMAHAWYAEPDADLEAAKDMLRFEFDNRENSLICLGNGTIVPRDKLTVEWIIENKDILGSLLRHIVAESYWVKWDVASDWVFWNRDNFIQKFFQKLEKLDKNHKFRGVAPEFPKEDDRLLRAVIPPSVKACPVNPYRDAFGNPPDRIANGSDVE